MIKQCKQCNNEMFQDEKDEWFCPNCETDDFIMSFNENDDGWMKTKFKVVQPKTKSVTIRLNIYDIEKAKEIAKKKNLPYQTLIKEIIHKNLV
jgi:predicted DNA binding CopG/RHH family protein